LKDDLEIYRNTALQTLTFSVLPAYDYANVDLAVTFVILATLTIYD